MKRCIELKHSAKKGPLNGLCKVAVLSFQPRLLLMFSILFSDSFPILVCKTSTCRVAPFPTSIAPPQIFSAWACRVQCWDSDEKRGRACAAPIGPGGRWGRDGHGGHGMPNRGNAGIGMQTSAECWWMVNSTLEPHGTPTFSNIKTHGTLGTALKFQLEFKQISRSWKLLASTCWWNTSLLVSCLT